MSRYGSKHPSSPLSPSLRRRLDDLIKRRGEARALALIGIPKATFARAVAGFVVRAGTAALIAQILDHLDERQLAA